MHENERSWTERGVPVPSAPPSLGSANGALYKLFFVHSGRRFQNSCCFEIGIVVWTVLTVYFESFVASTEIRFYTNCFRSFDIDTSFIIMVKPVAWFYFFNFVYFLGGLSLYLNHLIGSRVTNYDWPFGTLPFGLFGSNLDTRDLETYPRTYSGHFWNMSFFDDSRAVWVLFRKWVVSENQSFLDEGAIVTPLPV